MTDHVNIHEHLSILINFINLDLEPSERRYTMDDAYWYNSTMYSYIVNDAHEKNKKVNSDIISKAIEEISKFEDE